MTMVERLEGVAQESSNGWNNAGTGHSALMELNLHPAKTPMAASVLKKQSPLTKHFRFPASSGRTRLSAACCVLRVHLSIPFRI
ncbi:malate:quinone oxidoreductase [Escherichia coli]|nr:malate:quinone oxidoreductase [Escherichia coli]